MAAANTKKTATTKRKPRGKPFPKGVSGNPKGRPKDGESWAGVFKDLANKTAEELAEMFGTNDLGNAYRKFPKGVQMKYLVGGRILAALMHDPSGSLLNSYMERMEGKVPDNSNHSITLTVEGLTEALNKIYANHSN